MHVSKTTIAVIRSPARSQPYRQTDAPRRATTIVLSYYKGQAFTNHTAYQTRHQAVREKVTLAFELRTKQDSEIISRGKSRSIRTLSAAVGYRRAVAHGMVDDAATTTQPPLIIAGAGSRERHIRVAHLIGPRR